jgi:DNA-binding CsgD family transcriptional regulator
LEHSQRIAELQQQGADIPRLRIAGDHPAERDQRPHIIPFGLLSTELFPLEPLAWQRVLERCRMSPQQAKLAELLLYGLGDKQIAAVMRISISTVRSHLNRLFFRSGAEDRHTLAMRLVAASRTDIPFANWR